jgi:hypothetical protein
MHSLETLRPYGGGLHPGKNRCSENRQPITSACASSLGKRARICGQHGRTSPKTHNTRQFRTQLCHVPHITVEKSKLTVTMTSAQIDSNSDSNHTAQITDLPCQYRLYLQQEWTMKHHPCNKPVHSEDDGLNAAQNATEMADSPRHRRPRGLKTLQPRTTLKTKILMVRIRVVP